LKQKEIDKICATNKTGYADLWMKKEVGLSDKIGQIRNLKIKKLIKKSLGL
jgi:ribosomal protein L29